MLDFGNAIGSRFGGTPDQGYSGRPAQEAGFNEQALNRRRQERFQANASQGRYPYAQEGSDQAAETGADRQGGLQRQADGLQGGSSAPSEPAPTFKDLQDQGRARPAPPAPAPDGMAVQPGNPSAPQKSFYERTSGDTTEENAKLYGFAGAYDPRDKVANEVEDYWAKQYAGKDLSGDINAQFYRTGNNKAGGTFHQELFDQWLQDDPYNQTRWDQRAFDWGTNDYREWTPELFAKRQAEIKADYESRGYHEIEGHPGSFQKNGREPAPVDNRPAGWYTNAKGESEWHSGKQDVGDGSDYSWTPWFGGGQQIGMGGGNPNGLLGQRGFQQFNFGRSGMPSINNDMLQRLLANRFGGG